MKIGIDARLISQTGVGTYISNLLHYLETNPQINKSYFYVYLLDNDFKQIRFKNSQFIKKKADFRWHTLSEQIGFYRQLMEDYLDLVHFTYFSYPIFYKKKFLATIHDITPLLFKTGKASTKNPLWYEIKHIIFKYVISQQIKNAEIIITPSKTVKKQLVDFFGDNYRKKIASIYEGIDYRIVNEKASDLSQKIGNDFLIYVGNFYPHKNIVNLIKAYSSIKTATKLVLIGPNDYFTNHIFQLINRLKQSDRIILYHTSQRSDLVFFYKNARALIQPSLSEGFGLPLIEAAHFGLPIIASNIEVFREILDDKYLSFNPYDIADMKNVIANFLENDSTISTDYSSLLKKFSFEKMTQQTLDVYRQILK